MTQNISIAPFTRIEGHLSISLQVEDGIVQDAQCKGEMFRGFEQIMKGRSPLDAQQITQRICGVCPISHGIASVTAQEKAYALEIPENARLIRNIMHAGDYIQNNITHFYHLSALDFVDVAGILEYNGRDRLMLGLKQWLQQELKSKSLFPGAPFMPRFEGKYLKEHEGNLSTLKNYFTALDMRAKAHQLVAIFSGKLPHMATIIPGGVTEVVTTKKIAHCRSKLSELRTFYETCYVEDIHNVAKAFPEYFTIGKGCGNYLSYGGLPDVMRGSGLLFPAGALIKGAYAGLDTKNISEEVSYAKYSDDSGFGKTIPDPHKQKAYSWIKAPRYKNEPMEVGPLARIMIGQHSADGADLKAATQEFLASIGRKTEDLDSCLGRHVARCVETQIILKHCEQWIEMLDPTKPTSVDFPLPAKASGAGLIEAPRGALGHWITVEDHKVAGYECIVPTTWNCSPKDNRNVPGPVEKSLIGTKISDRSNPLEAARIVRAYDPCLACAVH